MSESGITVRDLRRQWKPHKQRLARVISEHPTNIRFHRACSWLQQLEELEGAEGGDLGLLSQWIAFNALYGQWNEPDREPMQDVTSWRSFLDRVLQLDSEGRIIEVLGDHKKLVMSILEDEYLSRFFWQEPGEIRARKSKKVKFEARSWYIEGRWTLVMDRLMERIYLLRCQLVHGAATCNSGLNRTAVRRCSTMLGHVLRAVLQVWIDHGADEDWGTMCYPPMKKSLSNGVKIVSRR